MTMQAHRSSVAICCVNSAAMLQLADQPGHSNEKLAQFRDLNEKQAKLLFEAAEIADDLLAALCYLVGPAEGGRHETIVPNNTPFKIECELGDARRAWVAIAKATASRTEDHQTTAQGE